MLPARLLLGDQRLRLVRAPHPRERHLLDRQLVAVGVGLELGMRDVDLPQLDLLVVLRRPRRPRPAAPPAPASRIAARTTSARRHRETEARRHARLTRGGHAPGSGRCTTRRPPAASCFRGAGRDHAAALLAALGAEIDDVVGGLHDVEVVLDDHDRVPLGHQLVQDVEQPLDVGEVEAGGRLVEDVERAAGRAPGELGRELHPLRLAARQGRRRLPEPDVVEPDVVEGLELLAHRRDGLEEGERLPHGHLQDLGDVPALVADLERLPVVALALAHLARHVHVGEEVHLDLHQPVALAGLAPAALDVEREAPGRVAARPRVGGPREQRPDEREDAGVRRRVGARGAADRRLVDVDDLVEVLHALEAVVRAGPLLRPVEDLGQRPVEDVVDERGLPGAGHARDAGERPQRDADRHALEVVLAGPVDRQELAGAGAARRREPGSTARATGSARSATSGPP